MNYCIKYIDTVMNSILLTEAYMYLLIHANEMNCGVEG